MSVVRAQRDLPFFAVNAVLSVAAMAFLTWLLVIHPGTSDASSLTFMPALNASLNATAALCLIAGWLAIRARRKALHRTLMLSAFVASAVFLVGYVVYHYVHGDTPFRGVGPIRIVYFSILISHILLSIAVVPLALTMLYFAWRRHFARHRRVGRIALPIWLYVSVTGVAIFFLLRSFG